MQLHPHVVNGIMSGTVTDGSTILKFMFWILELYLLSTFTHNMFMCDFVHVLTHTCTELSDFVVIAFMYGIWK